VGSPCAYRKLKRLSAMLEGRVRSWADYITDISAFDFPISRRDIAHTLGMRCRTSTTHRAASPLRHSPLGKADGFAEKTLECAQLDHAV
jgi:hypothetical protein